MSRQPTHLHGLLWLTTLAIHYTSSNTEKGNGEPSPRYPNNHAVKLRTLNSIKAQGRVCRNMSWVTSQATSKCCWIQFAKITFHTVFYCSGFLKSIWIKLEYSFHKKLGGLAAWARFIRADLPAVGSSPSRGLGVHAPLGWPGRTCLARGASWDACTRTPPCIDAS